MAKKFENGAAPVSKYAAKKAARAKANANVETKVQEQENATEVLSDDSNVTFDKRLKRLPAFARNLPAHLLNMVFILMNNAEIRRFTGIGICNYLKQKEVITGTKNFTVFKYNKFAVISDGLSREFNYSEPFFITCLTASFSSFAAYAQKTIDDYCRNELNSELSDNVKKEDIDAVIAATEEYQNNK